MSSLLHVVHLGMLIMQILLLPNIYHLVSHNNKRRNSSLIWDSTVEMILTFIRKEKMLLLDVVYLNMNRVRSYKSVTPRFAKDTMREIELHTRYCNLVSIGLLSSRMHVSLPCLVMNVKE